MRHLPSCVQGLFFAPAVVGLFFLLKTFCPASAGNMCFADQFSTPIFMPLIAVYRMFGNTGLSQTQEFLFVLLYWAALGFLLGLILDLWPKRDPYTERSSNDKGQMTNQIQSQNG